MIAEAIMRAMKKTIANDDHRCRYITATESGFSVACFLIVILALLLAPQHVVAEDDMKITHDKDKTTYTIGPSGKDKEGKTEYEKDKERSWDMLRNMNIIIDPSQGTNQGTTQGTTQGSGQSGQ